MAQKLLPLAVSRQALAERDDLPYHWASAAALPVAQMQKVPCARAVSALGSDVVHWWRGLAPGSEPHRRLSACHEGHTLGL